MPATSRASRTRSQQGMTLVELMIGLTIFAVILASLTMIVLSSNRVSGRTSRRANVQGNLRQAVSLLSTEIRQAGADPSTPPVGIVAVLYADSVAMRVRSDLSGDGVIQTTEPSEDVTYRYVPASRTLTRDPGTGTATVVADNVTAFSFTYFSAANTPLTAMPLSSSDMALVRSVQVRVTSEQGDSEPITLDTRITLRNR